MTTIKRRPKLVSGELYSLSVKDKTDWTAELLSFHHADRDEDSNTLVCAVIPLNTPMLYIGTCFANNKAKTGWPNISHKWLITNEHFGPHEVCCFNSGLKKFYVTHCK